jgi:hypothetical protein
MSFICSWTWTNASENKICLYKICVGHAWNGPLWSIRTRFIPAGPLVYELLVISVDISECTCFNPIVLREVFQSIQYHEIRFFQIKMEDIER